MQRFFFVPFFLILTIFLGALPNDKLSTATVKNSTGKTWKYLYISAKDSDAWCADLLGSENPLETGDSKSIVLYNNEPTDTYDVLAVSDDGKKFQKEFTCEESSNFDVEIFEADENGNFESLFQTVTVVNKTGKKLDHLFFSQDSSTVWGPDLLDNTHQVPVDGEWKFLLPLYNQEGGIAFNFLGVDELGVEYQLTQDAAGSEEPLEVTMDPSHKQQESGE